MHISLNVIIKLLKCEEFLSTNAEMCKFYSLGM